jgi:hypothetical protein
MSDDTLESIVSDLETAGREPALPPEPRPFREGTPYSWLVQMRDGRVLRIDAWRCDTGNGVLSFNDDFGTLIAAFEYGDWKRVAIMDRGAHENAGWVVLKEKKK